MSTACHTAEVHDGWAEQSVKKPCPGCPFSKRTKPGELGGSPPSVYIGQVEAGFWLPCHNAKNYAGKQSDPSKVAQCAGAAIFRSNAGKVKEELLTLPADDGAEVLINYADFLMYHFGITHYMAEALLAMTPPEMLAKMELRKAQVRTMLIKKEEAQG